jgi:hypothetical protein
MMIIKILCGGFVIAVLMAMAFDAYSETLSNEESYRQAFVPECQYMHDILKDETPVETCAHILAFRMSNIDDINNNAHARKK